jgi:Arf-GAP/coiled-coil/ANK repeat/PH domain-containing protein
MVVQGGKLSYQREDDPIGPPRAEICDLLISTVRECTKETDPRFTFEIISPGQRPYMLQAENEEEFREWIKALRSQTESLLMAGGGEQGGPAEAEAGSGQGQGQTQGQGQGVQVEERGNLNAEFLERIRQANSTCADCLNPHADWACINFGTVICIECSGIHRSLGVHVSKVRSLTLDKWTRPLRSLLEDMGNERFNSVWEARLPPGRSKPAASATREEREAWIRDKYVAKLFLDESTEGVNERLYVAAGGGNIQEVMWALAHGADPNWINRQVQGRTSMHAVCVGGNMACLELLLQHGGNLDVLDDLDIGPLELAMGGGHALVSYMLTKLERSPS